MRNTPFLLVVLLVTVGGASAQVTLDLVLDQEQFLRDESLPVKVRVTNRSGQTLSLGKDNEWLSFTVESLEGNVIEKTGEVPVTGEFALESAHVATRPVELMPYFDFSQPGRYKVTGTIRIKDWNLETTSKPKLFEIVRGTKLWEEEVGLPNKEGPPEVRKYVLQQANYRDQLKLYLRLTDPTENKVFRVFPIGSLVSFARPEAQIDKQSHLHVLSQTGARSFVYVVVQPEGKIVTRQTYDYTETRPILQENDQGKISVKGGLRRPTTTDFPPSPTTISTNLAPSVGTSTVTNSALAPQSPSDAKVHKK